MTTDIQFLCPQCSKRLIVAVEGAGRHVPCPRCQTMITIPKSSSLRVLVDIVHPDHFAFHEVRTYQDDDNLHCSGRLQNHGGDMATYVQLQIEWLNRDGDIEQSDWTFAVGGDGLKPGESVEFLFDTPVISEIDKCRLRITS